jgi:hypothetical protein
MVRSLRWWPIESKEFALSVVGGATGIRVCEKGKGLTRSILLDKDEAAWLIKSLGELVSVQDSRVFWNQSVHGFPRILAQQCSNRHGYFLTIEEYEGRRRSGSIMVSKGKFGEGWEIFGLELRSAFRLIHTGTSSSSKQLGASGAPLAEFNTEKMRSYAEVLRSSQPKLEDPLGPLFRPFPRGPKRHVSPVLAGVKGFQAQACPLAKGPGFQMKAAVKTTLAKSVSLMMAGPAKAARAPAFPFASVSGLRNRVAVSSPPTLSSASRKPATCKSRFGDNLDFRSLRRTLESFLVDVGQCLSILDQLGDGLLGRGPKQPVYRSKPKSRSAPLGSSFFWPKSSRPPLAQVSSTPTTDLKSKAPLVHSSFRPKLIFKAKVGSGPVSCDPGASSSSLDSTSLPPAGRAPLSLFSSKLRWLFSGDSFSRTSLRSGVPCQLCSLFSTDPLSVAAPCFSGGLPFGASTATLLPLGGANGCFSQAPAQVSTLGHGSSLAFDGSAPPLWVLR